MTPPVLCLTMLLAASGQTDWPPAKVATVNVAKVSEQYVRTKDLEQQFDAMRRRFNEQRNQKRTEAETLARSLDEQFKPGTPDYLERQKQLVMLDAELKWFVESESARLERTISDSLRGIYEDIQAMVGVVAAEKGIDIVLAVDELPEETPDSSTVLRQQIMLQKVLFASPRLDLTGLVSERLNESYKKRRENIPAAEPKP